MVSPNLPRCCLPQERRLQSGDRPGRIARSAAVPWAPWIQAQLFLRGLLLGFRLVSSGDTNYTGGLLGMFAALAGSDPNQPAPPDDEQEQANLQALEDRLTSTGNINDAWGRCTRPAS
jgi:hypothetical protein